MNALLTEPVLCWLSYMGFSLFFRGVIWEGGRLSYFSVPVNFGSKWRFYSPLMISILVDSIFSVVLFPFDNRSPVTP